MNLDYAQLARAFGPEAALVVGALVVLGVDLSVLRGSALATRQRTAAALGALACIAAIALSWRVGATGVVFGGVIVLDRVARAARVGVLGLTLLTLGVTTGDRPSRNPAEYIAVMLFAATGLVLMAAAQQLLLVFLALELASLSLYVLVGFDKSRPESAEAALKYFLFGGMSAAFLLFGFSLLYGLTGSIALPEIAQSLAREGMTPLLAIALVMVLAAFGFKSAAAPFHFWAPDAYQGAPAPSAALVASASKLAAVVLFWRLLWPGLHGVAGQLQDMQRGTLGWMAIVGAMAAASMLLGNLAALAQSNVRRLLAYSAIAHAGVLLLGVIVAADAPAPLLYYAITYGLATVGAFGVIAIVDRNGGCQRLDDLAGLSARSPLLALCLLVFVLSLAGIPPLAGFFGKFYVFAIALKLGGLDTFAGWLAVLAIVLSAVGLYYYLLILKSAFVAAPRAEPSAAANTNAQETAGKISVPLAAAFALIVAAALIIALGVWPSVLIDAIR
jgi:NADH-quinone oxidoreductase subunit N